MPLIKSTRREQLAATADPVILPQDADDDAYLTIMLDRAERIALDRASAKARKEAAAEYESQKARLRHLTAVYQPNEATGGQKPASKIPQEPAPAPAAIPQLLIPHILRTRCACGSESRSLIGYSSPEAASLSLNGRIFNEQPRRANDAIRATPHYHYKHISECLQCADWLAEVALLEAQEVAALEVPGSKIPQ